LAQKTFPAKFSTVLLSFFLAASSPVFAQETEPDWNRDLQVYLTVPQALILVFPEADEVREETVELDEFQAERVAKRVGHPLHEPSYKVFIGKKKGAVLGYAIAGEELGKFRPITSIVCVNAKGAVSKAAVMVYRESRGSEVRMKRFLKQYEGKGNEDPIRINRDIRYVSGATISCRSMNDQVRKVLAIVHELYLRPVDEIP